MHLYRDVLRAAQFFQYPNERGELWRDVIVRSAREEFEANRRVADAESVTRLLVNGREALEQAIERAIARQRELIAKGQGEGPPGQAPPF